MLTLDKQTGVSTHSHPKVAAVCPKNPKKALKVSTHSHPKVAAGERKILSKTHRSFNTQPPEGGCRLGQHAKFRLPMVSTHSHPKVAAPYLKKQEKSVY